MPYYDEFKGEEDSEYDPEDGQEFLGVPSTQKKQRKSAAGRKLIRWSCETDQLVLLCVDTVCTKQGITIPWDLVGKEINDTLTGEAIKQHLVKVRKAREQHGQQVPAKLDPSERRRPVDESKAPQTRKPVDVFVPMTPVRGQSGKKRSEPKSNTGEKRLSHLVYIKSNAVKTGGKKMNITPGDQNSPATLQRSKKSGSGSKADQTPATRGGKRSRPSQKEVKQEEVESDFGSPTKKIKVVKRKVTPQPSNIITLRTLPKRNVPKPDYGEPVPESDDVFTNDKVSPETVVLSGRDTVHDHRKSSAGYSDDSGSFTDTTNGWNAASYQSRTQTMPGELMMPSYTPAGHVHDTFHGHDAGLTLSYGDNHTMVTLRDGGNLQGNTWNNGAFMYNDVTAPRSIRNQAGTVMDFRPGGSGSQPFSSGAVRAAGSNFDPYADISPFSSQDSFSNTDMNAHSEVGNILIGNDTGRGHALVTPTTMTFGLDAGARMDGPPQPFSLGANSSITFSEPTNVHDSGDGTHFQTNTARGSSGAVSYGMSTLGLNSGPTNPGRSFDSSYGSFDKVNSQDYYYNHNRHSSGSYDAVVYEQQYDDDVVFDSPSSLVNIYGEAE